MSASVASRETLPRRRRMADAIVLLGAAAISAALAWVAAQAGIKGIVAGVGALTVAAALVIVQERRLLALGGLVLSLTVLLHKQFGPLAEDWAGGAPAMYITTFGVMLSLLYLLWAFEGGMARDLLRELRRPALWVPALAAVLLLPSLLVAESLVLSAAELLRMGWMYLLYVYLAVHVRTKREVLVVLGGLGVLAVIQLAVVILQWRTGGVLGLSFLGVPTELGERTLDAGALGRPFGTITHPVFMAALLGTVASMALALGLWLTERRWKVLSLALVAVCLIPMWISHTRASLVAFLLAAIPLSAVALAQRRLSWKAVWATLAVGLIAIAVAWPMVSSQLGDNFATDHFDLEVQSRLELNQIGLEMFASSPVVGLGLNNFQRVMEPFDQYGLIFAGHPVHNLFLLFLAETGVIGLLGVLLVGATLALVALRLARAHDPLLAGVGAGAAAVYLFFFAEEQLGFALRQDVPLAAFWIVAGLSVACLRMAQAQPAGAPAKRPPRARAARSRPTAPPPAPPPPPPAAGERAVERDARRGWPGRLRRGRPKGPAALLALAVLLATGVHAGALELAGSRPPALPPDVFAQSGQAGRPETVSLQAESSTATLPGSASTANLRIVFAAYDRATGLQAIYTATGDGSRIQRVSPSDGAQYSWPSWAFGGSKIVFTRREGPPGSPEPVYLMDADGSGMRQLTFNDWRNAQPKVTDDGRGIVFTSMWDEYPEVGLFHLDLATLEVTNLSAAYSTHGAADADPKFTPDGRIVFASSISGASEIVPTQLWVMDADGSGRQRITDDRYFNTDPEVSPGGRFVATASYRGDGHPGVPDDRNPFQVKLSDWFLVVRDMAAGTERILNEGLPCFENPPGEVCAPDEGPAYIPNWTPDGAAIGYLGILSSNRVCICVINADGTDARAVIDTADVAITWFDWIREGEPARPSAFIGRAVRDERLLLIGAREGQRLSLRTATPDRWVTEPAAIPGDLEPLDIDWSPDRTKVVFSARVPYDPDGAKPTPAPPFGHARRDHFTLDLIHPPFPEPVDRADIAERQLFLLDLETERVRQLTTPWTEDFMDGLREGDARANLDPRFSPDGGSVVFTNVSSINEESFVLRLDLESGEVYNLTNATAGAIAVADAQPSWSPDGGRIAFSTTIAPSTDIVTVDADGRDFRQLTDDDFLDSSPVWSPDGRSIAYISYRGPAADAAASAEDDELPQEGWALVKADVKTGRQTVLVRGGPPLASPSWSPDGRQIAYIAHSFPPQRDIYVVSADGGRPRPLQVTLRTTETAVVWR